jgi:CBS domain-containing protein
MDTPTVRTLMSSPVIAVSPRMPLPKIKSLLHENRIRRVPVVDHNDRLVGIITLGDVRNAYPSDATVLSVHEWTYLLDKILALDVMRPTVVTIAAEASVIDAARLMLAHKISGLPVVEDGLLVGMITESDIFRAIVAGQVPLVTPVATGRAPQVAIRRVTPII